MGINLKNVVVSMAVGAVASGLLTTNLNAITSTATYAATTLAQQSTTSVSTSIASSTSSTTPATSTVVTTNLDAWLSKLATAESGNRANIKVLDVNGRYSYGCLQFQMGTFKEYSQRYGIIDPAYVTSWEVLIYNCDLQKRIAKRMIQEKASNWRHWGYTVLNKGIGFPPSEERPVDLAVAL